MAGGLAFLAGATDVHGLALLHDVFVSFMSGNTTMLGMAIGKGDIGRASKIAEVIALFVAGATMGSLLATFAGSRHVSVVSLTVTFLLALPILAPQWAVPLLVLAMGVLNAALNHAGVTGISLTYVTGALVKFGQGLGLLLTRRHSDGSWWMQGVLWTCLLAGAIGAALLEEQSRTGIIWALPLLSGCLTLAAAVQGRRLS
jgi:uncharacterized membrane protein YoaK (UPF0700 family)